MKWDPWAGRQDLTERCRLKRSFSHLLFHVSWLFPHLSITFAKRRVALFCGHAQAGIGLQLQLPCTLYTVIHMCSSHQLGNAALGGLLLVALRLQAIRENPPLPLLLVQRRPQRLV